MKIEFASENKLGNAHGYLYNEGQKSGIIVIQEWWGVEQGILKKAEEFSKKGYTTIVPDLYRGKVTEDPDEAGHFAGNLDFPGAWLDIQGAHDLLVSKGCTKVGIVGFCLGGSLALSSTVKTKSLSCCVFFYGIPSLIDNSTITVPVQGHFGDLDYAKGFSDKDSVDKLEETFKKGNVNYELHRYPDSNHAFTNDEFHNKYYDPKATQLAFERMFSFFDKHLK